MQRPAALFSEPIGQPPDRWIHQACTPLQISSNGPFVQLDDGTLLAIDGNVMRSSRDAGRTWTGGGAPIDPGMGIGNAGHVGQFLRLRNGTLIVVYLDYAELDARGWDLEKKEPYPDSHFALWSIRSTDGGATWRDRQQLIGGYNADFMGLIQTARGNVVITMEHQVRELRRYVCCSFCSADSGATWRCSNWIDLGGLGHHDGATEPAAAELRDGRLLMLIRTSLGQFWNAWSSDDGRYWRVLKPSGIDASSAPGWLLRLADGRLALAWNRSAPEGVADWPKFNTPDPTFEYPASLYREELSLALSEDDGESWTPARAIARQPGGQLAYPYLHERAPGTLWVFTRYTFDADRNPLPPLAVELRLADWP